MDNSTGEGRRKIKESCSIVESKIEILFSFF